jgi:antitoxin (DNA-binding transcriptional repressor) of toxin-antitoxin stability system
MEHRLSATDLARKVGDILGRIRYRGDSFLIERNGEPVARIVPLANRPRALLREIVMAWQEAGEPDPGFADDLERVAAEDRPPDSSWDS